MKTLNQRGYVSLLTVSLMAVLISVVTVALVSQMTSEVRQSTDTSDRVAAQYAAESGAEDALAYLKAKIASGSSNLPNQDCSGGDKIKTLTGGIDPAITCRQVITSGIAQGTLQKDQSTQYDLSNMTSLDNGSLELDWDIPRGSVNTGSGARTFNSQCGIGGDTCADGSANNQKWDGPPALEVTIAYKTTDPTPQYVTKSIYLLPRCQSGGVDGACALSAGQKPPDPTLEGFSSIWQQNDAGTAGEVEPTAHPVDCYGAINDDYDCKVYFPGGPLASYLPTVGSTSQYVVRVKALGSGGDYRIAMFDKATPCAQGDQACNQDEASGGHMVPLALTNATIDVTAQVGLAYQRVVETPQVLSSPLGSTSYAVLGTDNICKTLDLIYEGGATYTPKFITGCGNADIDPGNGS